MDEQRAEFEAWAKGDGFNVNRQDNDNYLYSVTRGAWGAWQAATQRQQERIAELEAQVQALSLDAGRLDWLDQTRDFAVTRTNKSVAPMHSKVKLFSIPSQHIVANTLREAIDAAIAAGKGGS